MKKLLLSVAACLFVLCGFSQRADSQIRDFDKKYVKVPVETSLFQSPDLNLTSGEFTSSVPVFGEMMKTSGDAMLYGAIVHSSNLNGAYGIYRFKRSELIPKVELIKRDDMFRQGAGCIADDKYYWYKVVSYMGYLVEISYNVFNAETWELEKTQNLEVSSLSNFVTSLAYDPNSDEMYAISWSADGKSHVLNSVNIETGELTPLADMGNEFTFYTLSVDSEGTIYTIAGDGGLYVVNEDGSRTLRGNTGILPTYLQSAVYDEDTGLIYWAAFTSQGESCLCEVNPENGETEKIGTFPNNEEICGLFINTVPLASAPGEIDDLHVEYVADGSLNAVISCTAPDRTYGDTDLTGTVTVSFRVDNKEVKTFEVNPGEVCSMNYSFTEGSHKVHAVAFNQDGDKGPVQRLNTYAGVDIPGKVENLNLEISDAGEAQLTWNAPSAGLNGGYYDKSQLTYTIIRYPGDIIVAENYVGETFTEQLDDVLNNYFYNVISYTDGIEGGMATSNQVIYGSQSAVPYKEDFEDFSVLKIFTVIDANNDMFKWNYENGYMYYTANYAQAADDWIITPPVKMETGKVYELSFDTRVADSEYLEKMEVTIGNSNSPSSHKVLQSYELTNTSMRKKFITTTVDENNAFCIGFHACSDADMYDLYLDNISVEELGDMNIPVGVSDFTVTPAAEGELKATLSFKAPMVSYGNTPLSSITKIEIYKDSELVHEINSASPGREYTWTDENAVQGFNNYAVICWNESGRGQRVEIDKLVGIDRPKQVQNFKMIPTGDRVVELSWDAPEEVGMNGGYVNVDDLTYTIYLSDDTRRFLKIAENIKERSFVSENISLLSYQSEVRYDIYATSIEGDGEPLIATVIVGTPYPVPFKESLSGMQLSSKPWMNIVLKGKECWKAAEANLEYTVAPQDKDGGMFTFYSDLDSEAEERLQSPFFTLQNCLNPSFSLWFYHIPGYEQGEHTLVPEIIKQDGTIIQLGTINISDGDKEGWTYYSYSLSEYKSERALKLCLHGYSVVGGVQMLVDNLRVEDECENDLQAVSISMPSKVNMGASATANVVVQNLGLQDAASFKVNLCKDGAVYQVVEEKNLASKESREIRFTINTSAWDAGKTSEYYAEVVFDKDEKDYNDRTNTATMRVASSGFETVDDLTASVENNVVKLEWTPLNENIEIVEKEPVTDGAEDYKGFDIANFGDWTLYDGDGQATYAAIGTMSYPNKYMPMAWQIWAPEDISLSGIWTPRTGKHSFISWAATGQYITGGSTDPFNDDWLISPRVKGGTELKFFACVGTNVHGKPELLDIYVSYSDNNPDSFEKLGRAEVEAFGEWEEFKFNLPEDVQYFAIRYVSITNFAVMVDDITYTPSNGSMPEVIGYNVYRNGVKINDVPLTEATYSETLPSGEVRYAVSAVYKHGESGVSNVVKLGTGIDDVENSPIKVYTEAGTIVVEAQEPVETEIYSVDGMRIYSQSVENQSRFDVESGIYVVRIGKAVYKVIVEY